MQHPESFKGGIKKKEEQISYNSPKNRLQRWAKLLQTIHLESFNNYTAREFKTFETSINLVIKFQPINPTTRLNYLHFILLEYIYLKRHTDTNTKEKKYQYIYNHKLKKKVKFFT
jgi:hypothetical protein